MASYLSELVDALSRKRMVLEELFTLLEAEQRSIIEVDVARLENLDDRKRELLTLLERISGECRLLIKSAAEDLHVQKADNLSSILPKISPPVRDKLKGLQARLLELGESVQKVLSFNKDLLESSLQHVNDSLEFFNSLFMRRSTYGESGSMVRSSNEVRLVCKEI